MTAQATKEVISALETGRIAAMERNDVDAIAAVIHDECIYTHSLGDRDTRDTYLDKCRSGLIQYKKLACTIEKVVVRDEIAIVFGTMDGDAEVSGKPRRLRNCYTTVWTKDAGDWQVIAFQPTPVLT